MPAASCASASRRVELRALDPSARQSGRAPLDVRRIERPRARRVALEANCPAGQIRITRRRAGVVGALLEGTSRVTGGSRRARGPSDGERAPARRAAVNGTSLAPASFVKVPKVEWTRLCRDLWRELGDARVSNGAAALAFYMVLSLFPLAIFCLSVLPYLQVERVQNTVTQLVNEALPGSAADLVMGTVQSVVSQRRSGLLWFSFMFAVVSASNGLHGLMQQLNVIYDVREQRSFIRARGLAVVLTVAFFSLVVGALLLITCGGMLQAYVGDPRGWGLLLGIAFGALRWTIIVAALHFAFSLIYYLGPNKEQRFALVTPGSVAATVAMLVASLAFKTYVNRFSAYNLVYGGLGAVIVLLLWLFAAGWVILFGAELDKVAARHLASNSDPQGHDRSPGEHPPALAAHAELPESRVGQSG
jgi:membrane protein